MHLGKKLQEFSTIINIKCLGYDHNKQVVCINYHLNLYILLKIKLLMEIKLISQLMKINIENKGVYC